MPAPTIQRYWVMTRHPWPCGWMPYPSPCRDRRAPRGRSRTTGRGEPGGEGSLLTERLADRADHGIDGERLGDEVGFRVDSPGAQADIDKTFVWGRTVSRRLASSEP